jgi:putative cardiolipin synthase
MEALDAASVTPEALAVIRESASRLAADAQQSRFAQELRNDAAVRRFVAGDWAMHWSGNFRFVADDPLKALGQGGGTAGSHVLDVLGPAIQASQRDVSIISPYFVLGPPAAQSLVDVDKTGANVRVLTNSLAANDVALVYGGYSKTRDDLLEGGVELWELKPAQENAVKSSLFSASGASLHTKALEIDGRIAFVGSYNLDPRSTSLNCEQGIFVESPEIATQLKQIFAMDSAGDRAWSVTLVDGQPRWNDGTRTWDESPDASASRRFQAWLARVLPLHSQL